MNTEQSQPKPTDVSPLTLDQKQAFEAMQAFVREGTDKCFLLEGYAGTGKTFLIRRFVQWLDSHKQTFLLAAPTGRAAKVLTDKTGYPAGTVHRSIYGMDKLLEIPGAKEEDRFKFYYGLKLVAPEERPRVIVVDESSMVGDRLGDEKFVRFGSGRLLKDLLEFAGLSQADSRCQIVFVGDPAQLPPVGMNTSPALDANYLKREFGVESRRTELVEVVRQAADSAILKAAGQIRKDISAGRENRLEVRPEGEEIVEIEPSRIVDLWEQACPCDWEPSIAPPLVCVTWRNKTALEYNIAVRARLEGSGDGRHPVRVRDYLMIVANNHQTGLWNGELALVQHAAEQNEVRAVGIRSKEGLKKVQLAFRQVTLAVPGGGGTMSAIPCLIMENMLFGVERDLTEDEQIALWVDFKNRHPDLLPRTDEFKAALSADPYFNALRVKFGYAVTCHKAQGGEWPTAAVVFERQRPVLENLRWTYTAITRAKNVLYGVNLPRVGMFRWNWAGWSGIEDAPAVESVSASESVQDETPAVDAEQFHALGFPVELNWMQGFHARFVEELDKVGIQAEKVEAHVAKWFVRYQLYRGGVRVWMQVAFNNKHRLTLVDVRMLALPQDEDLPKQCRACFMRAQQYDVPAGTKAASLPPELRELREDYLAPAAERHGVQLLRVESLPYRERAFLKTSGNGLAVLDFCYDGRMRFVSRPEIHPQTTDRAFAERIIREIGS